MEDIFTNLSFSKEEALQSLQISRERKTFNRTICICGHPSAHHNKGDDGTHCYSKNIYCPCAQLVPVVEVEDLRFFSKITRGEGANHALSLGLTSLTRSRKSASWLTSPCCWVCKRINVPVRPIPLTNTQTRTFHPGYFNILACHECHP